MKKLIIPIALGSGIATNIAFGLLWYSAATHNWKTTITFNDAHEGLIEGILVLGLIAVQFIGLAIYLKKA